MLVKVVNNKISILRGETPVYTASLRKSNGSPLIILDDGMYYFIEFVVRPTIYSKGDCYIFRRYIPIDEDYHRFSSYVIKEYDYSTDWNDDAIGTEGYDESDNLLFKLKLNDEMTFKYIKNNSWVDYEFLFHIKFPYDETYRFEPKSYLYEINIIVGGSVKNPIPPVYDVPLENIDKKIIVLPAMEFRVEGSIGV